MDVFDLGEVAPGAHANPSLEKLAKAFRVNAAALKEEYTSILPVALALNKKNGKDNRSVWAECLARLRDRKLREKFPQGALYPVLAVYMAWTCSSSGVEQMFSKLKRSLVEGANGRADTDRRICAVAGTTPDKVLDEMLLKDAQAIYVRLSKSGKTRTARRARIDCMSKPCKSFPLSFWAGSPLQIYQPKFEAGSLVFWLVAIFHFMLKPAKN